jgi:hypothetical protein
MKKRSEEDDDILPEYDFAALGPGVRGKYAGRMKGMVRFVGLEADVAAAFPTGEAVNEALRAVLRATAVVRRAAPARKRSGTRPPRARNGS